MKKAFPTDEWTIYNCHIHTFTKQHTPSQFLKFVISDSQLGKINWLRIPIYLLFVILYFGFLYIVGGYIVLLSQSLTVLTLPAYAFLLVFESLLVFPVVVFFFLLLAVGIVLLAQVFVDALIRVTGGDPLQPTEGRLFAMRRAIHRGQVTLLHPNLLVDLLVWINPASSNDIFERMARFLRIASESWQQAVFDEIKTQYPDNTVFIVLPMDMTFMNLGKLPASISAQHKELCELAAKSNGQIIPFYAADPRQPGLVEDVGNNLAPDKFRGIKIYPNLGYRPDHPNLMEVYKICAAGGFPVITHCSPGGIWEYGLPRKTRREYSSPAAYLTILEKKQYRNLKLCLAHFGGAEEWAKQLNRKTTDEDPDMPWVRTIYEMITSGKYPHLYTDISYTVFTPRIQGLYIDLIDYLKVMLSHPLVRTHVLFGSDYYMVTQERMSEKEVSVMLRSRLGEELYKQIAYTNPREFLGLEAHEVKVNRTTRKKISTRR